MSRDLRELLHETAARPTRPLDTSAVVGRARRRTAVSRRGTGLAVVAALVAAVVAVASLLGGEGVPEIADRPPAVPPAEFAWRHLGQVEAELPDRAAAQIITDPGALAAAWATYSFPGGPGEIDFDHRVVLLLGQADDACPDTLIELEVVGERLHVTWLPPPGGCRVPLIMRLHAVEVHRGHLPERFTVGLPAPFDRELEPVVVELPRYEGQAPPPPQPPRSMTEAELEAVFADHAVRRCTPDDELVRDGVVDGPVSLDPRVAAAQQWRAGFGVASDEETVRRVMADPRHEQYQGLFPLLPEERQQADAVFGVLEDVQGWLAAQGWRIDHDVMVWIDRSEGIRASVVVGPDDADAVRASLDQAFGAEVVGLRVMPWNLREIAEAQAAVSAAVGDTLAADGGPGSIAALGGMPGPVTIGMIDPTREALDVVARTVDPRLVCVHPDLSGVR